MAVTWNVSVVWAKLLFQLCVFPHSPASMQGGLMNGKEWRGSPPTRWCLIALLPPLRLEDCTNHLVLQAGLPRCPEATVGVSGHVASLVGKKTTQPKPV